MREYQQKKIVSQRIYSKTALVLLALVLILVARGVYSVYAKERDSQTAADQVEKEQAALQARYESLQQNSDELQTSAGVEGEIRSKFDVVKPGEGVIVVVDKDPSTIQENKQGVLKEFWNSVVNIFKRK